MAPPTTESHISWPPTAESHSVAAILNHGACQRKRTVGPKAQRGTIRAVRTSGMFVFAAVALGVTASASATSAPIVAQPLVSTEQVSQTAQSPPATARLSPSKAGARRVVLTIQLPSALRCGRPFGGVVVTLPHAAPTPKAIPTSAVIIDGRESSTVSIKGHQVSVALLPRGITCHSITSGMVTITFSHAAGLVNPRSPGRYTVVVRHGASAYTIPITITR